MKAILRFQLPATVGSDLAGVVLEVGHHVTRFKPGDARVNYVDAVRCNHGEQSAAVADLIYEHTA